MTLPVIIIIIISLALIIAGTILRSWSSGNEASLAKKRKRRLNRWRIILKKHENGDGSVPTGILRLLLNPENLAAFADASFESVENLSSAFGILYKNERYICSLFGGASNDLKCFFAYTLSTFQITDKEHNSFYKKTMLSYLSKDSVFLRQNALLAIYSFGTESYVVDAFHIIGQKHLYHNERLISDGLLTFTGDKISLSRSLINVFDTFDKHIQIAIINFLRYTGIHDYDKRFIEIAKDSNADVDIRCASIRLFSKKTGPKTTRNLIYIIEDSYDSDVWEPACVAASAIGNIDDHDENKDAINCLLKSIHSKWWYVRINSAKSLSKLRITKSQIKALELQNDAYAMEELCYALDEVQYALDNV